MKIHNIRINGIENPVGFDLSHITLSYLAEGVDGDIELEIYVDGEDTPLYTQTLDPSRSYATDVDFVPTPLVPYRLVLRSGECSCEASFERGGELDAPFITPSERISHPVLFYDFEAKKGVVRARLRITGVGLYTAYINGVRVGDEYLTPYFTDYNYYLQYQTYEVGYMLRKQNRIEIALGQGWYMGRFGLGHRENIFGDRYAASASLTLFYADGTVREIRTGEGWRAHRSDVSESGIYDGEVQDATADVSEVCDCVPLGKGFHVIPRRSLPVRIKHTLTPTLIVSPRSERILDFGQNFAGFVSFKTPLSHGQRVKLTAAEVLQDGCFYRDNYRTARAEFSYVSDGIEREVSPKFTFFGFRYMLVEGIENVRAEDFCGNVLYSDMQQTVRISTDNEKMNRLLANCLWGQRSNFIDVPTDCPQRDERLGWTGDAQVFSRTACYQMDCKAFFDKYLCDLATDQAKRGGALPVYSPSLDEAEDAFSVWGDAATVMPWNLYEIYGDSALLKKHFPIMEGYLLSILKNDKHRLYDFGFHLGDWLSQDGASPSALKGATDEYFIASAYYYNSARLTSRAASVIGETEKAKKYEKLADEIYEAILAEYFTPSGRLSIDTQTAYVLCVAFDIYRDRERLTEGFRSRIRKDGYKVRGGFVGATQLIQALIRADLTDEAFAMLYAEHFPSWLYCVNLGATTIWERWNSLNPDGSVSGSGMNSLNHYSFGAVAEAFYAYVVGLRPLNPGFKRAVIEPKFNYRLGRLDFEFDSPSGTYKIKYHTEENKIRLYLEIPDGATAELRLPCGCETLSGGRYERIFDSPVEMVHPFSVDMPVCELIADKRAAAVLEEISPAAYHFLSESDMGLGGESLRALSGLDFLSALGAKLDTIDEKLKEISV